MATQDLRYYLLHDVNGNVIAGDEQFDQHMRARADEIGGYVMDPDGERVYPLEES